MLLAVLSKCFSEITFWGVKRWKCPEYQMSKVLAKWEKCQMHYVLTPVMTAQSISPSWWEENSFNPVGRINVGNVRFLRTTDMLKRYISVCISLCLFRFNFQSYSALPHQKNDHIGQLGKQDIMSYIDVSWHGSLVAISIITGAKEEVRRVDIKGEKCV